MQVYSERRQKLNVKEIQEAENSAPERVRNNKNEKETTLFHDVEGG